MSEFDTDSAKIELDDARKKLENIVNKNFDEKYLTLEICLSVKAQSLIDLTLPFCLILIGKPSSYKTTILQIVGSLPDCYRSDSFTAKSFVSHATNVPRTELASIDLLPKIQYKTLITPELAPLFSTRDEHLLETIGILTRILDGRGYQTDSGVHGQRGYTGDYYFTWIGALVEIQHKVWKILGNLGPKMYFLRIPSKKISPNDEQNILVNSLKNNCYNEKLTEASTQMNIFWEKLLDLHTKEEKIVWNIEKDDYETVEIIAKLSQILARLRAAVSTSNTKDSGGSNYNFERPIIEYPERATHSLYNLARGHAVLYGRNYVTRDELLGVFAVVLSSASIERIELFKMLIENNGSINTNELMVKCKVSRDTALKNMQLLLLLELVEKEETVVTTHPLLTIKLKEEFRWLLSDESMSMYQKLFGHTG